jgi:hypothetical protein
VLRPEIDALKSNKAVLGLPAGTVFDIQYEAPLPPEALKGPAPRYKRPRNRKP